MRKRKITRSCISIGLSVMMALSTFAPTMSVYADEVEEESYLESVVEDTENEINEEYSSGSDYEDSQSWEEEQQEEGSSSYEENYSSEEMEQDNNEVQTGPQTEPGSASEEIQSEVTTPEPEPEYQEVVPMELFFEYV